VGDGIFQSSRRVFVQFARQSGVAVEIVLYGSQGNIERDFASRFVHFYCVCAINIYK
jgi:hypothetical protein